jgi:hypothetical protein
LATGFGAAVFAPAASRLLTRFGLTVPLAWLKLQLFPFILAVHGVWMTTVSTAPGPRGLSSVPSPAATMFCFVSNQVSAIFNRASGADAMFLTLIVVTTVSPFLLLTGWMNSTSA